jgi:hypothetical protein
MAQPVLREGISAAGRPASLRLVRSARAAETSARRPSWAALYTIVCLTILMLFGVASLLPTDGTARTAADLSVVLFGFVLVWIWLRVNRSALARIDHSEGRASPPEVAAPAALDMSSLCGDARRKLEQPAHSLASLRPRSAAATGTTVAGRGAGCSHTAAVDQTSLLPPHAETLRRS